MPLRRLSTISPSISIFSSLTAIRPRYQAVPGGSTAHDDEPVGAGLGAPHLTRPPEELAHACVRPERHARELPGPRREPPEPAPAEVGQPDHVPVVDIDGVH